MARWKAEIQGLLKRNSKDLFPEPEFTFFDITVNENSVIRLSKSIREKSLELNEELVAIKILKIDRIDKRTEIDYSSYCDLYEENQQYSIPSFRYILDSAQVEALARIEDLIYSKLESKDDQPQSPFANRPGYYPKMLYQLDGNHTYITGNWGGIYSHEQAIELIESIENFYLKLTPIEISILNIDTKNVSFEDYAILKKYYDNNYEVENIFQDRMNTFIGSKISDSQIKVLNTFLNKKVDTSGKVIQTFLSWIANQQNSERILKVIDELEFSSISKINSILGLLELKKLVSIWETNKLESSEEYWQKLFEKNSILLSQIFAYPVSVIGGKVYVGGKNIFNKKGNIADFLMTNKISDNVMIVEIKTPSTKLMGTKYRGIINVSSELSGATIQLSNYKDTLVKEFISLTQDLNNVNAYNPDCFLIVGNMTAENFDTLSRKSFELYRKGLSDIQIITFDELFAKATALVDFLEGNTD